jgi:threonine dehydrogenase-like Zn-dependent dehydrogenase
VVEQVGAEVRGIAEGDFVIAPFYVQRRHMRTLPRGMDVELRPRGLVWETRNRRRPGGLCASPSPLAP